MASNLITVDVRLPKEVAQAVKRIAELAGVKPEIVIRVMLAIDMAKRDKPIVEEPAS